MPQSRFRPSSSSILGQLGLTCNSDRGNESRRRLSRCFLSLTSLLRSVARSLQHNLERPPIKPLGDKSNSLTSKKASQRYRWVDGIRGLAATSVVLLHTILSFWGPFAYTYNGPGILWYVLKVFISAEAAVQMFFVLSGFVLSVSFIEKLDKETLLSSHKAGRPVIRFDSPLLALSSTALRRFPRLAIPVVTISVIAFGLAKMGAYVLPTDFNKLNHPFSPADWYYFPISRHPNDLTFERLVGDVMVRMWTDFSAVNIWNAPSWSLAMEMYASVVVFFMLLATCSLKKTARVFVFVCAVIFCQNKNVGGRNSEVTSFFLGVLAAERMSAKKLKEERHHIIADRQLSCAPIIAVSAGNWPLNYVERQYLSSTRSSKPIEATFTSSAKRKLSRLLFKLMSIAALYLYVIDADFQTSAYHSWLHNITSSLGWQGFGAAELLRRTGSFLFLLSAMEIRGFQDFLERPILQFCGRVSFGMYLTHTPFTACAGIPLTCLLMRIGVPLNFARCLGLLFIYVGSVTTGYLLTIIVEQPVVQILKTLENKVLVNDAAAIALESRTSPSYDFDVYDLPDQESLLPVSVTSSSQHGILKRLAQRRQTSYAALTQTFQNHQNSPLA